MREREGEQEGDVKRREYVPRKGAECDKASAAVREREERKCFSRKGRSVIRRPQRVRRRGRRKHRAQRHSPQKPVGE